MGHKSNTLTIRQNFLETSLISTASLTFFNGLALLKSLSSIFKKFGVIITSETFNITSNKIFINLNLFYKSIKSSSLKKRIKTQTSCKSNKVCIISLNRWFSKFLKTRHNLIKLSLLNLNFLINSKPLLVLFNRTKKFLNTIFSRRFNLYLDFLKLSSLYLSSLISTKQYTLLLGQVFKFVSKKSHTKFIAFLKVLFKLLISESINLKQNGKQIMGVKFIINGKLQGKPRSTSVFLQEGIIPIQTLSKQIHFFQTTVFTLLGTFGLKLWVYKN